VSRERLEPSSALLAACRVGDRDAFAQLFELCRDRVYAVALSVCADRAAAADVSQEVFMKLLTRLTQFEGRASFATWLYRLVINTAIDHQRAARRLTPLSATIEDSRRQDRDYERAARKRRVEAAVRALPETLRAPLVLRHVEGLAYADIAEVLSVSVGTVASRLSRAHARLARELAGEV
jgi:RNA polymerase sigma-70 factor (ECF subfamily)